jgi:hypothetical protein
MTTKPIVVGPDGSAQERDRAPASAAAAVAPDLLIDTCPAGRPPARAVTGIGSGALLLVVESHSGGAAAAMTLGSVSRYAAARYSPGVTNWAWPQ